MKNKINSALIKMQAYGYRILDKKGESGVNTLIGILIGIIVGGLLLAGITALVNWLFPEITAKIADMFGITGATSGSTSA